LGAASRRRAKSQCIMAHRPSPHPKARLIAN
jgi:hypothetical protein